ncbi:MAG: hypothetical protein OEN01_10320 [Candidatus Krumholzibacteria bacterium]|nr:hypothetical protein [Candidatus Krumholzibacteria bacterium]
MRFPLRLAVAFLPFVLVGCAPRGVRYAPLPIDPAWGLLFVANDRELYVDPRDSNEPQLVFESSAQILLPRCSPNGKTVAFYRFTDRRGALDVLDLNGASPRPAEYATNTLAELDGPVGERTALFPPIWESGGNSLLVVDESGIHRIAMDRQHELLVVKDDIVAVSISAGGERIAYADGATIFVVNKNGEPVASVGTTSAVNPDQHDMQPIAFSPDGQRIAYAAGRYLHVLDLGSMTAIEVTDMRDGIFWVQWLAGERLVFTSGKTIRHIRTSPTATPYGMAYGAYELYSIGSDGHDLKRLFKDVEMDAHLAQPTLSNDGRYVALVSGSKESPRVMIVATDEARATPINASVTSNQVSWLPAPLQLPSSLEGAAPAGRCRAVVVYPLD